MEWTEIIAPLANMEIVKKNGSSPTPLFYMNSSNQSSSTMFASLPEVSYYDRVFRDAVNSMDVYVVPLIIIFGIIGKYTHHVFIMYY